MARCLDLSVTVVKGRLQRGRQRLQSELTIVEEHFMENQLPSDFAEQIQRLLNRAASGALQDDAVEKLADMGPSVIEALCDALTDERKWVRHVAVLSLCEIGDTRALHPVMRLLHFDPGWVPIRRDNGWVDREVLSRVLSIPGCRVRLLETVRECDQHTELPFEERQALHHRTSMSLHALSGATGDEEAYDTVARLLDAPHPHWLRGRALHTLCDIKPDDAPDLISQRLKTGDEAMYEAAFEMAVPHRAVTRAVLVPVAACVHTIDHGPVSIKGRAVSTLCQHGSTGRVALDALLSSASRATSAIMASTLARMGDPTGAAMLEEGLLGTASGRDGFVPWGVRHGLEHRNEPLRVNLWTLALRYPECAGDLIEGIYEVGGPNWKRAALKILCRKKGPAMLPELRRHLASGRPHHNLLAKEAFWQMLHLGVAAASTASEMFDSDDWKERKAAVGLMRRWGTLTETQQKRAADDPHIAVQHAAGRR